jgi:streptogramin lyase
MQVRDEEQHILGKGILHPGARPMEVFLDEDGCLWLCDKGVDSERSFEEQGCWRCKDLQFTRND